MKNAIPFDFRNALSLEMLKQLKSDLLRDVDNVSLRCIVLSAEGKVFSSGHNLKELVSVFCFQL